MLSLNITKLPPAADLEQHLMTPVESVTWTRPSVRIHDWDVYYNPKAVSYSDRKTPVPWTASQAGRLIECATLDALLATMTEDYNEWVNSPDYDGDEEEV